VLPAGVATKAYVSFPDPCFGNIAADAGAVSARTVAELPDYFEQLPGWPQHYKLLRTLCETQPDTSLLIARPCSSLILRVYDFVTERSAKSSALPPNSMAQCSNASQPHSPWGYRAKVSNTVITHSLLCSHDVLFSRQDLMLNMAKAARKRVFA
jgi:hypothetical protein